MYSSGHIDDTVGLLVLVLVVGLTDGLAVLLCLDVGTFDGLDVGTTVGTIDGSFDGSVVGTSDGVKDSSVVGTSEGVIDGVAVDIDNCK